MHSGALPKAKRAAHLAERSRAQGQITRIPAPTAANSSPPINSLIHALMVHPPGRVEELRWRVKPWETVCGRKLIVNKEMGKKVGSGHSGNRLAFGQHGDRAVLLVVQQRLALDSE